MKKTTTQIAEELMEIDNYVWEKHEYKSRPSGYEYIELVLEIADHIAYRFKAGSLTQGVQDILTNENYHTLNDAIDIVKWLSKRA